MAQTTTNNLLSFVPFFIFYFKLKKRLFDRAKLRQNINFPSYVVNLEPGWNVLLQISRCHNLQNAKQGKFNPFFVVLIIISHKTEPLLLYPTNVNFVCMETQLLFFSFFFLFFFSFLFFFFLLKKDTYI